MENTRSNEIAFFGKITAGITHELKNVLAVIKETSGLMGDLMDLTDEKTFQHKGKFQKSLSTIQKQIENGVTLLTHLNKFAHSPDKDKGEIDLHQVVNDLIILCGRYARLKNITLNVLHPDKILKLTTCQVSFQTVVFSCLEYCISHLPQGSQIEISVIQKESDDEYLIKFDCSDELLNSDDISIGAKNANILEELQKTALLVNGKVSKEPLGLSLVLSPHM